MLATLLLLLSALAVGVGVGAFAPPAGAARRRVLMAAAMLLALGGGLTVWSFVAIRTGLAAKHWPTTSGRVLAARLTGRLPGQGYTPSPDPDRRGPARPLITFEYVVAGVRYELTTDLHVPRFGASRSQAQLAAGLLPEYQPGDAVTVHYDPQRPARAELRPGPLWNQLTQCAFGWLLLAVGGALALMGARVPAPAAPPPAVPTPPPPAPTAAPTARSSAVG